MPDLVRRQHDTNRNKALSSRGTNAERHFDDGSVGPLVLDLRNPSLAFQPFLRESDVLLPSFQFLESGYELIRGDEPMAAVAVVGG